MVNLHVCLGFVFSICDDGRFPNVSFYTVASDNLVVLLLHEWKTVNASLEFCLKCVYRDLLYDLYDYINDGGRRKVVIFPFIMNLNIEGSSTIKYLFFVKANMESSCLYSVLEFFDPARRTTSPLVWHYLRILVLCFQFSTTFIMWWTRAVTFPASDHLIFAAFKQSISIRMTGYIDGRSFSCSKISSHRKNTFSLIWKNLKQLN